LRDFIASLAPRAALCLIESGDHALRCAREQESVIQECAAEIARWLISLKPGSDAAPKQSGRIFR
jgi:hypothetical protein